MIYKLKKYICVYLDSVSFKLGLIYNDFDFRNI